MLVRGLLNLKKRNQTIIPNFTKDEAMTWLSYINPGMLMKSNLDLFAYCIDRLPNSTGAVIEIGSFAGLSLNHLILLLKKTRRENSVFSVDEWIFENASEWIFEYASFGHCIAGTSTPFDEYRRLVIDTFRSNVMLFNGDRLPHHIELSSNKFFSSWDANEVQTDFFGRTAKLGGSIAFAYIDGAHTYEQSMRDFQNIDRHLIAGGFIVFDDSADNSDWGSRLTAQEATKLPQYELVAKNPNYCIRKIATGAS
jgi:hypothetical protein